MNNANYDVSLEKELYNQHLSELSRVNYLFHVKIGILIYPMWSLIDFITGEEKLLFYFILRSLFTLPLILIYYGVKKRILKNIDLWVFLTFLVAGAGVSTASFYVGGISSGYINGLLFLSFVQFTVIPIHIRYIIFLDIAYLLLYFPLNYYFFNDALNILIREMAIYINFAIFKYFCAKKAQGLIYGTMEQYGKTKDIHNHKEVSDFFGELCHLISNPLFIARETLKRAKKTQDIDERHYQIDKTLESMDRITNVVKKMQKLNRTDEVKIKEYKNEFKE